MTIPFQYDLFEDVADFHKVVLGLAPAESPSIISFELALERFRFMQEELDEYLDAAVKGDIVGVADGLADIIYVAIGTLYIMGLPGPAIWEAVQKANMSKVRGITKRGNMFDAVKPEGWTAPEAAIAKAIGEAIK